MFISLLLPSYDLMVGRLVMFSNMYPQVNHLNIARMNNEDSTYPRAKSTQLD